MAEDSNKKDKKVWIPGDPLGIQPGHYGKKMPIWKALLFASLLAIGFYSFLQFVMYRDRQKLDYFTDPSYYNEESGYNNGIYCAALDEGKFSKQKNNLLIEIEDDQIVDLFIPGKGWLNESYYVNGDIYLGTARIGKDETIHLTVIGSEKDCLQKNELTQNQILNLLKNLEQSKNY